MAVVAIKYIKVKTEHSLFDMRVMRSKGFVSSTASPILMKWPVQIFRLMAAAKVSRAKGPMYRIVVPKSGTFTATEE